MAWVGSDPVEAGTGQRPSHGEPAAQEEDTTEGANNFSGVLRVRLGRLALYSDSSRDTEQEMYASLRLAYGEYRRRLESGRARYLVERMAWLLQARSTALGATAAELTAEATALARAAEAVYTMWNQLKGLRQHRAVAMTPAKLVAVNFVDGSAEAALTLSEQLQAAVDEAQGLDESSRLVACAEACAALAKAEGLAFKLRSSGLTSTDAELPASDRAHQRRRRRNEWYAVVSVDGTRCFSTRPSALDPRIDCVDLNCGPIDIKMRRRPAQVSVALKLRRPWWQLADSTVAVASCEVPSGEAVSARWLQAASQVACAADEDLAPGDEVEVLSDQNGAWKAATVEATVRRGKCSCFFGNQRYYAVVSSDENERIVLPRGRLRRQRADVVSRRVSAGIFCELSYRPMSEHAEFSTSCEVAGARHNPIVVRNAPFDPNDPRNLSLLAALAKQPALPCVVRPSHVKKYDSTLPRTRQSLLPVRLMSLRWRSPHLFSRPIPARGAEVDDGKRRLLATEESAQETPMDRLEAHATRAAEANKCKALIRSANLAVRAAAPPPRLTAKLARPLLHDVVWRRRRALRPRRRQQTFHEAGVEDGCGLLVQVISAASTSIGFNRNNTAALQQQKSMLAAAEAARASRWLATPGETACVMEARLQEHLRRTSVSRSGRWKETLDLPLLVPTVLAKPAKLGSVEDRLRLCLFADSVDSNRSSQRRFVGDMSLKFGAVFLALDGCLEGSYELNEPVRPIGVRDALPESDMAANLCASADAARDGLVARSRRASYARVAVFARPTPPRIRPRADWIPNASSSRLESAHVTRYAAHWVRDLRLHLETLETRLRRPIDPTVAARHIEALAVSLSGDAVLLCRFLRPLAPPAGFNAPARAARFVAFLPYPDDVRRVTPPEIWLSCQTALDLGVADACAHGVLLHNLLAASIDNSDETFLALGRSLDEPRSVYVLQRPRGARASSRILVWNPRRAIPWVADDANCPLLDLGCLISSDNVYANLQPKTGLKDIDFALDNRANWRPLFGPEGGDRRPQSYFSSTYRLLERPDGLPSLQPPELVLDDPDVLEAERIQFKLTDDIKRRLRHWRAPFNQKHAAYTSFSVDLARKLQNFLPILEKESQRDPLATASLRAHLASLVEQVYDAKAFDLDVLAFNFPNIHSDHIFDRLQHTNIHAHPRSDCQFIVAVYVHPLPHHLFSLWIFYGHISPKTPLVPVHDQVPGPGVYTS